MGVLNTGLNRIRDLVSDDIVEGILGTDGSAFDATDTALNTPISASEKTTVNTKSDKSLQIRYRLDSTSATGNTFREFGDHTSGDIYYGRSVFPGVAHTSNDEVVILKTYFWEQG